MFSEIEIKLLDMIASDFEIYSLGVNKEFYFNRLIEIMRYLPYDSSTNLRLLLIWHDSKARTEIEREGFRDLIWASRKNTFFNRK